MTQLLFNKYAYTILDLVRSSITSVEVLCYVVNFNLYKKSDKANLIFLELKHFRKKGGTVRVLLDMPRVFKPNYHPIKFFTRRFHEADFDVRYAYTSLTQHAKLFLFDRRYAVAGSHNWTSKSVVSDFDVSFCSMILLSLPVLILFLMLSGPTL